MTLRERDRVLFDEDGRWTTGTVVALVTAPGGLAIRGDLGGIHYGGERLDRCDWVIPVARILDAFLSDEDDL